MPLIKGGAFILNFSLADIFIPSYSLLDILDYSFLSSRLLREHKPEVNEGSKK